MTNSKQAVILTSLAIVAAGLAALPAASANNQTVCNIDVCASAAAGVDFKKNPWWMPDTVTYFCGWMGYSMSPFGGSATGTQSGSVVLPDCNHGCAWHGQGGCGDQGSAYRLSPCTGVMKQWTTAVSLFAASSFASAVADCGASGDSDGVKQAFKPPSPEIGEIEGPSIPEPTILHLVRTFLQEAFEKGVVLRNPDFKEFLAAN